MLLRLGVQEMDLREFIEGQSKEDSGNKKSLINKQLDDTFQLIETEEHKINQGPY